jgi:hypothetical protein
MSSSSENQRSESDSNVLKNAFASEPLDILLAQDARSYPVACRPWFAQRMAALARETPQSLSLRNRFFHFRRFALPLPLAFAFALMLLVAPHAFHAPRSDSFRASFPTPQASQASPDSGDAEFEEHMEMLASTD